MKKSSEELSQSEKGSVNSIVFPFSSQDLKPYFKDSERGKYLLKYFDDLKAKTCILEEKYIDKDYMIDYQKFYSRSFELIERFTTRIHFFDKRFSDVQFENGLNGKGEILKSYLEQLKKSYLGCVVVKPEMIKDHPLIGRTLLKTYPFKEGDKSRFFIREEYHVS